MDEYTLQKMRELGITEDIMQEMIKEKNITIKPLQGKYKKCYEEYEQHIKIDDTIKDKEEFEEYIKEELFAIECFLRWMQEKECEEKET